MRASAKCVISLSILALILGSARGSSLKSKLAGKWNYTSAKTVWKFKSDRVVHITRKDDNSPDKVLAAGSYPVIDGETVELRFPSQRGPLKANVESLPQGQLRIPGPGAPPFVLTPFS
jgi:hypothetical protein